MACQLAQRPPNAPRGGVNQDDVARLDPVHLAHQHLRGQSFQQHGGCDLLVDAGRKPDGQGGRQNPLRGIRPITPNSAR
jgi:hypothetical protein